MILRHRLHAIIVRAPREGKDSVGDVCWADGHCASEKVTFACRTLCTPTPDKHLFAVLIARGVIRWTVTGLCARGGAARCVDGGGMWLLCVSRVVCPCRWC